LGSSLLATAQQLPPEPIKSDCDKKVLRKIKKEITASDALDHLRENTLAIFRLVCYINEDHIVELTSIEGNNDVVKQSIMETFDREEISCPNETAGVYLKFTLTLKKHKR
jgi:hypothetical protein